MNMAGPTDIGKFQVLTDHLFSNQIHQASVLFGDWLCMLSKCVGMADQASRLGQKKFQFQQCQLLLRVLILDAFTFCAS